MAATACNTRSVLSHHAVAAGRIGLVLACVLLWTVTGARGAGKNAADAGRDNASGPDSNARVVQTVNRLTYGPTPGLLKVVADMGVPAFIDSQLEPEKLEELPLLVEALDKIPAESMDTVRLFREYGPSSDSTADNPGPEAMRRTFDRAGAVAVEAANARLLRAVMSRRQLSELMVAFWSEHFSLGGKKGLAHLWVGSFEREAIRPHALGKFVDLLAATAMHPAMLIARGNWKNVVHREQGSSIKEALDQAYAGILISQQTLGPGGPQKPADTLALARILTGWRVGAARGASDSGGFYFDVDLHDPSDKMLLGHPVKGTGLSEGAAALRILAGHPATAKHLCHKLAVYFLTDEPPAALVSRMVETFGKTDGDIRETLRTLFTSPEFFDPKYAGGRFKSPLRQVVSAVRAVGAKVEDATALAGVLAGLGQPLYEAGGPEGYPVATGYWQKTDRFIRRVTFAGDLAGGHIPGLDFTSRMAKVSSLATTLGATVSEATVRAADKVGAIGPAMLLASPDFMRY